MRILKNNLIIPYLIIGLLSIVIYFVFFSISWEIVKLNYTFSISIAYIVSVVFHFIANRRFTFNAQGANLTQHITKYGIMLTLNYLITLVIMYITVEILKLTPYIGVIFSILVNTNLNFFTSRYWVFREIK